MAELRVPARVPVLLLGGLNLVRALAAPGLRIVAASSQPDAAVLHSRFTSERLILPAPENVPAAAEALARAGERLGRPVLMYGDDRWLSLLHASRDLLASRFRLLLNEPALCSALTEKDAFAGLAQSLRLPVPRVLAWDELGRQSGPVLVKPRTKTYAECASAAHLRLFGRSGKARVYASGGDLARDPLAQHLQASLMVQEYVSGDDRNLWSFHGFSDESGRLLAWFVGRKLRTYPALTGHSSYLELAHNGEFAALGRELAARLQLKGVFKMDFKQDAANGRYYLMEVNPRYNLWHRLGAKNGVNLPRVAYDYLAYGERPREAPRFGTRVRWLCLRLDIKACREQKLTTLAWLRSLMYPKVYDLFSWDDPLPALREWFGRGMGVWRLPGRLLRWLSTAS